MSDERQKKRESDQRKPAQATVYVSLKDGVLDPQGLTIKKALDDLGYRGIKEVRSGKFFQIVLDGSVRNSSLEYISEISDKLLANPVIEKFEVKLKK
jgi:phosphoribosylformylglycinamidine synthase